MSENQEDFHLLNLAPGIGLHLHPTDRFKTVRIDIFIQELLQPKRNTRLALTSRLLERGTRQLPELRSLNRFVDQLYGAVFAVEVDQVGDRQVIHLCLELVDDRYLPEGEQLLRQGVAFLHAVLRDPVCEGKGFRRDYLRQEKKALALHIDALFNDKLAYAQRRCLEAMCGGEPYGLSPLGEVADFRGISAPHLLEFHWELLAGNPLDIFVCGRAEEREMADLWERFCDWERHYRPVAEPVGGEGKHPPKPRLLFEEQEVSQGRLVLGYRTGTGFLDPDYPALVLFNLLWGGDHPSRLFRWVREAAGLCYYIASHLEGICGLLFVTAGIEAEDYAAALEGIQTQLEAIRAGDLEAGELEAARSLLINRLLMLDDERGGLVRFYYRQRIGGRPGARRQFCHQLEGVTLQEVRRVAGRLELDTVFFLHGNSARVETGA